MRVSRRRCAPAVAGLILLLGSAATSRATAAAPAASTLRVAAAASLADAFGAVARAFEAAHPGTVVRLDLAGSQQLTLQLEQGAAADVFASADPRWMDVVREHGLVSGEPRVFARNRLVVIVPRDNPAGIERLQDLAKPGVKVVMGAEAVPVGAYGRAVLRNLSRAAGFDPDFARRVLANLVSEEESVKSVAGKVQLGEADAGLVYRSDVSSALARAVRVLEIPDSANVLASYPIAVLRDSRSPERAREFVALVLSAAGQRLLERHGLMPVASLAP